MDNRAGLCFARQEAGGVADDLRLLPAFLQHACTEPAHGHDADLVPEHLRRTLDLELLLRSVHGFTSGGAHGGDHAGAPGKDACPKPCHSVYPCRTECISVQAGLNCRTYIRGDRTACIGHGIYAHCAGQPLCRSASGALQAFPRQHGLQSGFYGRRSILSLSSEVIAAHAFANASCDIFASRLYSFGGGLNLQRRIQRSLQIGSHRFRIAVKARFRHALGDALANMRAGAGYVQPVQEFHNGLQVAQILFRHTFTLPNGADQLGNVG